MAVYYPGIRQSLVLFIIYLGISVLTGFGIAAMTDYLPYALTTLIGAAVSMILIILVALHFKQAGLRYLFEQPALASPLVYAAGSGFTLAFILLMDPLVSLIPMPAMIEETMRKVFTRDLYSYLAIGISAPILEELLFRKIMLEGLEQNYGPRKAVLWSAVFFAIFHMNPWQGIGAFIAGLFLGWLFVHTRDIWLCIFIHFFNNSVSFVVFFVSDDPLFSILDVTGSNYYSLAIIMGISLLALYFCYRILHTHFKLKTNESFQKAQTQPFLTGHSGPGTGDQRIRQ